MRSVEEQLALITDTAMTPEPVRIAITDALGMMCAEEVQASQPLPGFPQAAIDGYAVRAVDIGGERALRAAPPRGDTDSVGDAPLAPTPPAAEKSLPVVGEVPAGSRQPLRLQPKQVVRVHTGAPLPTLSDAVLPLEWTDRGRKRMTPYRAVRSGILCGALAMISSQAMLRCLLARSWALPRLVCWLRWEGKKYWPIHVRGCLLSRMDGSWSTLIATLGWGKF